jgi:hypothetical protein
MQLRTGTRRRRKKKKMKAFADARKIKNKA